MKFIGEKFGGRQQIRKKMLENLRRIANSDLSTLRELLAAKEKWLDELRSKKVKLEKNGCKG